MKLHYIKNLVLGCLISSITTTSALAQSNTDDSLVNPKENTLLKKADDEAKKKAERVAERIKQRKAEKAKANIAKKNEEMSVLITGANRGLGLELVKQFIKDGYIVYGTARKPEEAIELKKTGANIIQLDVTSGESINAMATQLKGKPLDILINNAGYFGPGRGLDRDKISTLTREEMENCFNVNTLGPLFVAKALLPNLSSGTAKKIVNMSSRSGIINNSRVGGWGYRVSKAGLNMVTSTLHAELSPRGFIVVSVAPGHNKTDMTTRGQLTPEQSMPQLKRVIEGLTPRQSSKFWYYDGSPLPW